MKENEMATIMVALKIITVPEWNARRSTSPALLAELMASMSTVGLLQPIVVRQRVGGKFEVICGARRVEAARQLKWDGIAATVVEATDSEARKMNLTENLQREGLTPLEEAQAYRSMVDEFGMTVEEIAALEGKTANVSYVYQRLKLAHLSGEWALMLANGEMPLRTALRIARLSADDQGTLWAAYKQEEKLMATVGGVNRFLSDEGRLQEWIEGHLWADLSRAPFGFTEELVPHPCSACTERTGAQPMLFEDLAEAKAAERCLNVKCFQQKVTITIERAKAKNPDVVELSEEYSFYTKTTPESGVLLADRWVEPRNDDGVEGPIRMGVIVEGARRGHRVMFQALGDGPDDRGEAARKAAKAESSAWAKKVKVRRAQFEAVCVKLLDETGPEVPRVVYESGVMEMIKNLSSADARMLARCMGENSEGASTAQDVLLNAVPKWTQERVVLVGWILALTPFATLQRDEPKEVTQRWAQLQKIAGVEAVEQQKKETKKAVEKKAVQVVGEKGSAQKAKDVRKPVEKVGKDQRAKKAAVKKQPAKKTGKK